MFDTFWLYAKATIVNWRKSKEENKEFIHQILPFKKKIKNI
jgi:hypothetical protein